MDDLKQFSQRLKQSFESALADPIVSAERGDFTKVLVYVVSPTFEGMDEGDRQEIVWERVLEDFAPDDQRKIEFIYTDAPSEVDLDADDHSTIVHD